MRSVDEILERAKQLSAKERAELLKRLEDLDGEPVATRPTDRPYARSLAASGSGHTDSPDVSSDKYKHLGEAYADGRDG